MNKQHILGAVTLALCLLSVYIGHQKGSQSDAFEQWKTSFGINFDANENQFRRMIFEKNVYTIDFHNADQTQTYKMGINQFTALTNAEFVATYLGARPPVKSINVENPEAGYKPLAKDIDWTKQGKVSPVKNQGNCGSCWAFSAIAVTQSRALQKNNSVLLSEQQLVDCSGSQGNRGCGGGFPGNALEYMKKHGSATEKQYPYTAQNGNCKTPGGSFKINGIKTHDGCSALQDAINTSPVSVGVDGSNWHSYKSGVFSSCGHSVNHAVLLVGVVGGNWKIKNSWGTSWGQQGFIRLSSGNTCGICLQKGVVPNL